jgi:hypothetical protein
MIKPDISYEISDLVYSREESPLGRTWAEWTAEWWKWILEIPKPWNPGYDVDGTLSRTTHQKYSDPFFLAGTYGGKACRTIRIEEGKSILLPVINVTTSFAESPDLKTKEELLTYVEENTNDLLNKRAVVDGTEFDKLDNYRVRSDFFTFTFPDNNIYNALPGRTTGISDGYWLFLRPLLAGSHTLYTSGSCLAGRIRIEVQYTIEVVKN